VLIHSTKGVTATTGTFSGNVNADSVHSTKGITATTGTFSGIINGDTLHLTSGFSAASSEFGNITLDTAFFGAGNPFTYQDDDYEAADTMYDGTTLRQATTAHYSRIGDMYVVRIALTGTVSADSTTYINVASSILPPTSFVQAVTIVSGSTYLTGNVYRSGDRLIVNNYDGGLLPAASTGLVFYMIFVK
jgi:hypothetical protein